MKKSEIVARVLDRDQLECRVITRGGQQLVLSGSTSDEAPEFERAGLGDNRALVLNAWSFAIARFEAISLPEQEQQRDAAKRADVHRKVAVSIAELMDDLEAGVEKHGWCSVCFGEHSHRKVKRPVGQLDAYLCTYCGWPTTPCAAAISCANMATRGTGALPLKHFCAEHRHEIPGFTKADRKMGALNKYEEFLKYDKPNLSRATKVAALAGAGLVVATPIAFAAAPAIGGAVGAIVGGYSGAAATSYGLALLGGGAMAAGGLGMAGGTLVLTALGAGLGGALGASVMNAYLQQDKSFHIEMLRGGSGVPVVVCNGFLSENGKGWGNWERLVTERYPDNPVYRVHWGAKELKHLALLGGGGAAAAIGFAKAAEAAMQAAKMAGKKLGPLAPALIAADLAKNPWHVAKNRADKTGVILADLLARTDQSSYVLVGHSLGARAMVVAAQTLATKNAPRIDDAHLLGTAMGAKGDWRNLTVAVNGGVYNYHSTHDNVLKLAFGVAQGGQSAAGLVGFTSSSDRIKNIDVSHQVKGHSLYLDRVSLE